MTYKTYEVHVYSDDAKYWYQNGNLHREDGPAIEYADGGKEWYQNDLLHRDDGPAVEGADGTKKWYIEGVNYTEAEFLKKTNPPKKLTVAEVEKLLGYSVKIVKELTVAELETLLGYSVKIDKENT